MSAPPMAATLASMNAGDDCVPVHPVAVMHIALSCAVALGKTHDKATTATAAQSDKRIALFFAFFLSCSNGNYQTDSMLPYGWSSKTVPQWFWQLYRRCPARSWRFEERRSGSFYAASCWTAA